jgi:hypothetical protein
MDPASLRQAQAPAAAPANQVGDTERARAAPQEEAEKVHVVLNRFVAALKGYDRTLRFQN